MTANARSELAVKWSALDRLGSQAVQFIISIILARLLLPEEFGLIAMLTIFFAVAQSFTDSGFGAALIQKKEISQVDKCSIFYFNILVGFLGSLLVYFVAPAVADFYSQSDLESLMQFLSINILISSFSLVHFSLLSKELKFKKHAVVSLASALLSGVAGVMLALNGAGVWALAIQQVVSNAIRSILLWRLSDWRPSLTFSTAALKEMFGFGSRMLAAGLLDNFFKNFYLLVIGKIFPPAILGYYVRAQGLKDVVSLNLTQIITRVAFPVFSSIQDENERMKRGLKRALGFSSFVVFPSMIGMAAVAEPLVLSLLTEKWLPSVFYLQLLCIVGLLLPLQALNLSVIKSKGRSDLYLRLEIIKKGLIILNVAITWRWGVEAIIIGQIILSFLNYYINCYFTSRFIKYSLWEQLTDVALVFFLALIMGSGVYWLGVFLPGIGAGFLLLTQVIAGVGLYVLLCWIFRVPAFKEVSGFFGR